MLGSGFDREKTNKYCINKMKKKKKVTILGLGDGVGNVLATSVRILPQIIRSYVKS